MNLITLTIQNEHKSHFVSIECLQKLQTALVVIIESSLSI